MRRSSPHRAKSACSHCRRLPSPAGLQRCTAAATRAKQRNATAFIVIDGMPSLRWLPGRPLRTTHAGSTFGCIKHTQQLQGRHRCCQYGCHAAARHRSLTCDCAAANRCISIISQHAGPRLGHRSPPYSTCNLIQLRRKRAGDVPWKRALLVSVTAPLLLNPSMGTDFCIFAAPPPNIKRLEPRPEANVRRGGAGRSPSSGSAHLVAYLALSPY